MLTTELKIWRSKHKVVSIVVLRRHDRVNLQVERALFVEIQNVDGTHRRRKPLLHAAIQSLPPSTISISREVVARGLWLGRLFKLSDFNQPLFLSSSRC